MSKHVQIRYDMNCYDSYNSQTCQKTCLNLFRVNMIQIDTILKNVKTRNKNMTKYTKIEYMARGSFLALKSDSLDCFE